MSTNLFLFCTETRTEKEKKKKKKRDGTKQTGLTIQYINTNSMNSLVRHLEVNQSTFPRQIDACNEPPVGMGKGKKEKSSSVNVKSFKT